MPLSMAIELLYNHLVIRRKIKFITCEELGGPYQYEAAPDASSDGDSESNEADAEELQDVREALNFLLQHGADVDSKDTRGYSLLHVAARARDRGIVEILLQHGVQVNIADKQGQRPLHLAIDKLGKTGIESMRTED